MNSNLIMWNLLLILPLGSMAYSDFRVRRITLVDLSLFGCLQWIFVYYEYGIYVFYDRIFVNAVLFCLLGGTVVAYCLLRYGLSGMALHERIGAGDVWFCLLLLPAFSCWELTLFLTFSGSVILLLWWLWTRIKGREETIPLVGGLGSIYILLILMRVFCYG